MQSSEILRYMKDIPTEDSVDYDAFWEEERRKAEYGVTINGVYIPGWLYWHCGGIWNLFIDYKDEKSGISKRRFTHPDWRDNEWIFAETVEEAHKQKKGAVIFGARQIAKELADYEPIITPNGEIPISQIKIGDVAYGRDGKETIVTGVFPQGVKPIYRLHFLDGRYIDAGLEHQWIFKQGKKEVLKTTRQLLNLTLKSPCKNGGYTYIFYLPTTAPVEFPEKELPIDPYLMGLLLGDGDMTTPSPYVAAFDDEIEEYMKDILGGDYEVVRDKYDIESYGYPMKRRIKYIGKDKWSKDNKYGDTRGINPIAREIRALKLNVTCYDKFIPDIYKYSSVEQRMELLRGLNDSDGSINTEGSIEFSGSNERLVNDVAWIARSLGIRCEIGHEERKSVTKKMPNGKTYTFETEKHRCYMRTDLPVFKLKRKLNRIKKRKNTSNVALDRIEYLGDFSATCIAVDNDEHLYLTKDFIVTHNSDFSSSYLGRYGTLYEGTQNIITAGSWPDIDNTMYKISTGLDAIPAYFRTGRLTNELRKEIALGVKDKKGNRHLWSRIIARNHDGGHNTEALANLTISSIVVEEIGKHPFSSALSAAIPALETADGWRASPILLGTSGDMEKAIEARRYFEHPEANNMIVRELKEEGGKKCGVFMSGYYQMRGKVESTLGDFVQNRNGILIPKESELFDVPCYVTDKEKAEALILEERRLKALDPDPTVLLKAIMYAPLNTKELFLSDSGNKFPIEAINEQIEYLIQNPELQGEYINVFRGLDGKPAFDYNTRKKPIIEFPLSDTMNIKKDACPVMFEKPLKGAPTYLYVASADPYAQSSSKYSDSLGAFYVFKRMYDPINGTFQRRIVCSYVARPDNINEFYETCELLAELYNAVIMPENETPGFIQYFDLKLKAYLLADGFDFLKEIAPTTSITNRPKGLPAIPKVQNYYMELIYRYLTEKILVAQDPVTRENIYKLGVIRINDIGLLRELAAYNKDGNFDRIVCMGHALAHEVWADKIYPFIEYKEKPVENTQKPKPVIRSPFSIGKNSPFGNIGNNPFGL